MSQRFFAIGDVHGCATELKLLLNKLPLDADSTVVFLGDYVDRGNESKDVIQTVIELSKQYNVIALAGNHELMFLDFLHEPSSAKGGLFIYNGGASTLASYGQDDGTYTIPDEHIQFLKSLKLYHEAENFVFVHAGVPDMPLDQIDAVRDMQYLTWVRGRFYQSTYNWGKRIIHGHTPTWDVEIHERRVNVDTGCVRNNKLSCIELPSMQVYQVAKQQEAFKVQLREKGSNRVAVRFVGTLPVYVKRQERLLQFETRNYSETGMLMREIVAPHESVFDEGEVIEGEIGSQRHNVVPFSGKIVRRFSDPEGIWYGIQLHATASAMEKEYEFDTSVLVEDPVPASPAPTQGSKRATPPPPPPPRR